MDGERRDIRIVALDLDGTLLDSEKRLSEVNRVALEAAARRGIAIVPTTGRFFGAMPEPVRNLPFVRYAITINGAQVYDRLTDAAEMVAAYIADPDEDVSESAFTAWTSLVNEMKPSRRAKAIVAAAAVLQDAQRLYTPEVHGMRDGR